MSQESPVNILLVDDQPENLITLEAVLGDLGYNLILAGSGKEALRQVLEHEFAIILLDINMPGTNGFETAALIRQRDSCKHVPIIFLTAMYTEDADEALAYSLGAVDFLIKPFVPEVLRTKVSVFAELYRKSAEIKRQSEVIAEIEKQRIAEEKERMELEGRRIREDLLRKENERMLLQERSFKLQEADRLKTEFLANMSHEIRTPMNGVIGMAELLLQTPLSREQKEFAQIIRESAQALLIIINDILDLSKIEAGKLELESIDFDLVNLVESTAELLSESARNRNLNLMTFIDPTLPRKITSDPGRLRQILMNLIGNAVKFTEQGDVIVSVTRDGVTGAAVKMETDDGGKLADRNKSSHSGGPARTGDNGDGSNGIGNEDAIMLKFSVTDTGIGLSNDSIERLFRPFSQADGSTTRRYGGTGLGLSICKRLVELMDGAISVASKRNEGSTFSFTVPIKVLPGNVELRPLSEAAKSARILIADERESNRNILQSYLEAWGTQCQCAASIADGYEQLLIAARDKKPFDIVITEIDLQDISESKFLERIRGCKSLASLKVVVMSSSDVRNYSDPPRDLGVAAIINKPMQQSRLFECIETLMRKSGSLPDERGSGAERAEDRSECLVLLAEDNIVNQKVAVLQLTQLGLRSVAVSNGREAVEAMLRNHYDLVLMDCQMPDMDGFEATKAIRDSEAALGHHTPIIGLTAHAMEGDRERCISAGMDDYLSKPTSLDRLSRALDMWLPTARTKMLNVRD